MKEKYAECKRNLIKISRTEKLVPDCQNYNQRQHNSVPLSSGLLVLCHVFC